MKPAKFEYFDPSTVAEAVGLLEKYGAEGKILAGGQSLVPLMNFRLAQPQYIIDINKVAGLSYLREKDGLLLIGALTRHRELERSELIKAKCPLLSEAASFIGYAQIRNRGTIGGSLAHADPASELPAVALCLGAKVKAVGPRGERTIEAGDLFQTYLTTSLEADEMIIEVQMPALKPGAGWAFIEISRRQGDFAIVGVGAALSLDAKKICREAKIAIAGVAPTPIRADEACAILKGETLGDSVIEEASKRASHQLEPDSDIHASSDYRKDMARVFTARALKLALSRAKGGR